MLASLLFYLVFQGLALWAAVVALATIMPTYFGLRDLFQAVATPPRRVMAACTPAAIPAWTHAGLTVFWLLALRVLFYLLMASYGLLPRG